MEEMAFDSPRCCQEEKKPAVSSTVVTIKITKKQLEELLRRADMEGLPIQLLLSHLSKESDAGHRNRSRPWRPTLQSIAEVAE